MDTLPERIQLVIDRLTAWAELHEDEARREYDSEAQCHRNIASNFRSLIAILEGTE